MKKALVIIAAVLVGLIVLAGIGSLMPKDPALQIEQDAAKTQAPTPTSTLNAKELTAYTYVDKHLPELTTLYKDLIKACDNNDISGVGLCAGTFAALRAEWKSFPAAGGRVLVLELAYEDTANGIRQLILDAISLDEGTNISDATLEKHITTVLTNFDTCQAALDDLKGEAQSSY